MKLELGFFYISITREGIHIEVEGRTKWFYFGFQDTKDILKLLGE